MSGWWKVKTNIVLIGMTGSGKTTIGQKLSHRLSLSFVDVDKYIEQKSDKSIPELFDKGEECFRQLESKACKEIASNTRYAVISCGGGVILRQENITALKKHGWIIFIDRPIEDIVEDIQTEHRPLLEDGVERIYQLAKERTKLYHAGADFVVKNDSTIDETVEKITTCLPLHYRNEGK